MEQPPPPIEIASLLVWTPFAAAFLNTYHSLGGVQHFWKWDSYTIVILSNGAGRFYNNGMPEERYECRSAPLDKLMFDIGLFF